MEQLHPVAQVVSVITGAAIVIALILAVCTDFFDNISQKK